jgi:hypothetical protein
MEIQEKESKELRALKKEVRDGSGVDTERLNKNVSVQMMKTSLQKYLQNK